MKKIINNLWKLFLFSFPFSLHLVLFEKASYRFGNFNPWVTGFLYLPEILLFIIFALWLIERVRSKELSWPKQFSPAMGLFLLFVLNAGVVSYVQGSMVLFSFMAIRMLEAFMFYLLLRDQFVPTKETIKWLLYGASFQILLAFLQTRVDHSLGLQFLGEPNVSPDIANVAKIDLADGTKEIRGYGTFLHPNIMGAYLMTILFVTLPYLKKAALPVWMIIITTGIFLTGSLAAELATVAMFILLAKLAYFKRSEYKKWVTLGVLGVVLLGNSWLFINSARVNIVSTSIQDRLNQNVISLDMFLNNSWGVGTGNFTLRMEEFAQSKLMPWDFQPVHNAYFLTLTETGIQGLILVVLAIGWLLHAYWKPDHEYDLQSKARILPLMALVIIASFDHLLVTSYIGPMLIALVLSQAYFKPQK